MKRFLCLAILVACKKDADAPAKPPVSSGAGAGSAAVVVAGDAAVAAAALAYDKPEDNDPAAESMAIAFDGKIPRLPAISADGRTIAAYDMPGGMPTFPSPFDIVLYKLGGSEPTTLEIFPLDEASKAEREGSGWKTPPVVKTLRDRATAAVAKLAGFHSLDKVDVAVESSGEPKPTRIGDVVLSVDTGANDQLIVMLRDGAGQLIHRETFEAYDEGTRDVGADKPVPCSYRPALRDAFRDPAARTLYVEVGFRWSEGCDEQTPRFVAWSLDGPRLPDPELVTKQFDVVGLNSTERDDLMMGDAVVVTSGRITTVDDLKSLGVAEHAMDYGGHSDEHVQLVISRDGKSAWASELTKISLLERNTAGRDAPWRASDVLVQTPKGWRIAALAWTEPVANAQATRQAKAGKLAAAKLEGAPGDPSLRDAFEKLTAEGVDATAAARTDLVAIGSGPGERTVGGAAFARAWNAAWKGKVTIVSAIARTTPSGTTGWVAATIELQKTGYQLPFTVFAVFDKVDQTWSLVHIHFAT